MADETTKVHVVAGIKELLNSKKIHVSKTTAAISKAPDEALRVEVDENGNGLLHQVICILRDRSLKSDVSPIVKEIIRKDPESVCKMNCHGQLALHLACQRQEVTDDGPTYSKRVINALVEANPLSTNVPDKIGRLPLHYATSHYWGIASKVSEVFRTIFRSIITEGAARTKDDDGFTPLHYAVKANSYNCAILRALLDVSPAACEVKSNGGDLPIHYSAGNGNQDHFKRLAEAYPQSLKVRNGEGKLPLDIVLEKKKTRGLDILAYLVSRHGVTLPPGTDLSTQLSDYMTYGASTDAANLISRMPVEHFSRALSHNLVRNSFAKWRRDIVIHALGEFTKKILQTPPTTIDEAAAAKAEVDELKKRVEEIKQSSSDLENQLGQGKDREANLEKQKSDLEDQNSNLEDQISNLENHLHLEKTKRKDKVSSLQAKLSQTEKMCDKHCCEARESERMLLKNHLPSNDTNAMKVIAQSLDNRLTKMRTQRSVSQNFLSVLVAQEQPDQAFLVQVVQTLNSELAEIEDGILNANNGAQCTMSMDDALDFGPSEDSITRKRPRVSLSPTLRRDEE